MRIAIGSDFHLEFGAAKLQPLEERVDVLILAGDVNSAKKAAFTATQLANGNTEHIVLVAGNHEFYGTRYDKGITALQETSKDLGVHFLHDSDVTIEGQHFAGGTMWTDFDLDGRGPIDQNQALHYMNDYRRIKFFDGQHYRRLLPLDTIIFHFHTREFLRRMATPDTIVITHHAPDRRSVNPKWAQSTMNSAYASHVDTLGIPRLWIHGHMHDPVEYQAGDTRVIANPRGYPMEHPNGLFEWRILDV